MGQERDWKLLQRLVRLLRAATGAVRQLPPGTWMRLAALHIHCLRQLSPRLAVSAAAPQRAPSAHRKHACGRVTQISACILLQSKRKSKHLLVSSVRRQHFQACREIAPYGWPYKCPGAQRLASC